MRIFMLWLDRLQVAISTHSKGHHNSSRRVESGIGFLDNNAVNFVMALLMSIGGMAIAGFLWSLP